MTARIIAKNIRKSFNLDVKHSENALARIVGMLPGSSAARTREVIHGLSLEVKAGEILGIVGKNGTGKSTLLRIIAGIYRPDAGEIATDGKLAYISGFGQGLQPKLTMRENIHIMCSIRGLSQKDIRDRFDDIVQFADLADFVDVKLYQFSTGMISRLNFSVILHCIEHQKPDILLLDEVFSSGGDIDFREKASGRMEDLVRGGAAVIMVSHELDLLERQCHRLMLLGREGEAIFGTPRDILEEYRGEAKSKEKKA